MSDDTNLDDFTVTVDGVTVHHNSVPWRVCTNRHSNTDGTSWGWIEGAPGNICWSNNSRFRQASAMKMAAEHNAWLEDQKPLSIRLIEARDAKDKAYAAYDRCLKAFQEAEQNYERCNQHVLNLEAQYAKETK